MTRFKTPLFIILSLVMVLAFELVGSISKASALTLDPANYTYNLIDDPAYRDSNTMSAAGIQAFLNSTGSGLANFRDVQDCGSPGGANYAYYAQFYRCGTQQVAAQIIYDAAQAYGINPQVILATLQKEQSLITTPNPTASQLTFAMGYGCPDSGGCSYPGFFNQVDNAAWQFRTNVELGNGNNWWGYTPASYPCNGGTRYYSTALKGGNTVTFYDDNGTPFSTITLANMATASLYCYTPHVYNNPSGLFGHPAYGHTGQYYSGSYNFAYYYALWFGSPTGELVRTVNNGQVYIVNSTTGKKHPINSLGVLSDYGALGLRYVTDSYLNQYTIGAPVGNMVQGPDSSLYLVTASIKLPFTSCSGDIVDYGYTCASDQYVPLTAGQVNKLASGPAVTRFIKSNTNGTVYYMSAGKKRPLTSWDDLVRLQIPIAINTLSNSTVNIFSNGSILYGPGSLVKTAGSGTIYVVKDMSTLMSISSFYYPQELGLSTSFRVISDADFQSTYNSAAGAVNLKNKVICNSSNYLGTNGRLHLVSGGMATNYNLSDFVDAGSICPNLSSIGNLSQYIRTNNGTIYYVSSNQKRAFSSYATYQSPSYCNNTCSYNQVSDFFADSIPNGPNL